MTAAAHAAGSGARIVLAGACRRRLGADGPAPRGHAVAMVVLDHLKAVLPQVPEPAA